MPGQSYLFRGSIFQPLTSSPSRWPSHASAWLLDSLSEVERPSHAVSSGAG